MYTITQKVYQPKWQDLEKILGHCFVTFSAERDPYDEEMHILTINIQPLEKPEAFIIISEKEKIQNDL